MYRYRLMGNTRLAVGGRHRRLSIPDRLMIGSIMALLVALLGSPVVEAQDDYDATVANDTNAIATSNAEIKAGDIVTGHNSGNSVSTADTHEGSIVIDGGIFVSPTKIDFYIDSGYNDAYADGGFNDASTDGPETDVSVSDDLVQGDGNTVDESSDTEDSFNSYGF